MSFAVDLGSDSSGIGSRFWFSILREPGGALGPVQAKRDAAKAVHVRQLEVVKTKKCLPNLENTTRARDLLFPMRFGWIVLVV